MLDFISFDIYGTVTGKRIAEYCAQNLTKLIIKLVHDLEV